MDLCAQVRGLQPHASVERVDDRGEVLRDHLAPIGALGGEFLTRFVEVALDDREVHDPLERREESIHRDHQRSIVVAQIARAHRGEVHVAVVGVGHDEHGVVGLVVTDQEHAFDRLEVAKEVLHALRRHRLALDVLVDLLLAVHEAEMSGLVLLHEIAGAHPAVGFDPAPLFGL